MANSSEAKNLKAICEALDHHDRSCKKKPQAIMMSQFEIDRLGWEEIRGIPIKPDDKLGTGRFRIVCDGYHGPEREEKQTEVIEAPSPAERELVPAGAPSERPNSPTSPTKLLTII